MRSVRIEYSSNNGSSFERIWGTSDSGPYFLTDIVFTQDQTYVDKLEFTAYADAPTFEVGVNRLIKLWFNKNTTYHLFFIIKVVRDDINKTQRVTCASAFILMDWIPYMEPSGTTPTSGNIGVNNTNAQGFFESTFVDFCLEKYHPYIIFGDAIAHNMAATDNFFCNDARSKYLFGKYSDYFKKVVEDAGYLMRRRQTLLTTSTAKYNEIYDLNDLDTLKTTTPKITITEISAFKKLKATFDITKYYTHGGAYYSPQSSDTSVATRTSQVRSPNNYGAKYLVLEADPEAKNITTVLNNAKNAVKQTRIMLIDIEIDPEYIEANGGLDVLDVVKISISGTAANGYKLIVTKAEHHIDDPLKSKYTLIY